MNSDPRGLSPTFPISQSPYPSSSISRNRRPLVEQKADLYAILQTAKFLKNRFDQGAVDPNFYIRRMRHYYQQIMDLQQELVPHHQSLLDVVEGFDLEGTLKPLITVISSTMDYEFNNLAQQWQLNPYELAGVATLVTSDFITLLDYLHIAEDFDESFVMELLGHLIDHLQRIHTFQPFYDHLIQLRDHLPQYFRECYLAPEATREQIRKAYSQVEEIVYTTFQNFKSYLRLETP